MAKLSGMKITKDEGNDYKTYDSDDTEIAKARKVWILFIFLNLKAN